jgi:hypothetical protein
MNCAYDDLVDRKFLELDHLEPADRRMVLARVPWWAHPLMIFISLIPAIPVAAILAWPVGLATGSDVAVAIVFLTALVAGMLVTYQIQLRRLRHQMRLTVAKAFAGQRPPFCFRCGYDLRSSVSSKCPECGADLAS